MLVTEMIMAPELTSGTHAPTRKVVFKLSLLAVAATVVIFAIATIVFIISKRSVYDELEITISLVALALFGFLWYALYNGARLVGKPSMPQIRLVDPSLVDAPPLDSFDFGGSIGSIVASIVLAIVLAVLLAFVLSALWSAVLLLIFALYWLFYRAMRIVLLKSFECSGNLAPSLRYAFIYTFLYTGWLFAIVWVSKVLASK